MTYKTPLLPITEEMLGGSYTIPAEKLVVYSMAKPPEPVGYWVLYPQSTYGHIAFAVYHKPTPEQIKNTEELLGWGWKARK